ncbi:MAG: hypothetical protein A2504_07365 [Bdellovibrionales bacterium RIFOXYD12_FULL_39_22]|nr:MAG: hypothetical protein A2385_16735 [Bdellovibrionales bacterium RIFOXYB1_FULL_39_21]OFZ44696.1 MAG: hypothetical protein A2485_14595 [Bdellovibrionales bacterium RIFOXYC12_FULL_39_17]OFZ49326.1 MAG: hypothetical protein A2404_08890 [Bdellovibrionales bacterium RIFOXYC1_FULL_39_130]OFZ69692.1 MAG: hypothetical protein A2451_04095 [Bdellovibrionales bacterium RIFOXYC2_FULL_39_8]OFZ77062.1 MAG: hypothetical protein A2560_09855 [Bdellovibrionales bacterium RIFOXYD1_FULL_39_84]OFZ95322.1 MAG:
MKKYQANDVVSYGVYASINALDIKFISADGESLGGKEQASYFKIPTALMVIAAPLIGGAFVLFFPFMIILMVCTVPLYYFIRLITVNAGSASEMVVKNVGHFTWEPMTAYLNKRKNLGNVPEGKIRKTPEELKDLEKEIAERRNKK